MRSWRVNDAERLSAESLRALFDNEIPAIRIPDFATSDECRAFAEAMRRCETRVVKGATEHSSPAFAGQPIRFIGLTQYEFKYRPMADYLDAAEASRAEVAPVLAAFPEAGVGCLAGQWQPRARAMHAAIGITRLQVVHCQLHQAQYRGWLARLATTTTARHPRCRTHMFTLVGRHNWRSDGPPPPSSS